MIDLLYQWIDLLWLPIGWFAVHKRFRLKTIIFLLSCIFTLRMQVELMESMDKPTGFLTFMDSHVYERGLVVYGILITLFLLLAHFSPRTREIVFLAAAINIYIFSLCLSMIVLCL